MKATNATCFLCKQLCTPPLPHLQLLYAVRLNQSHFCYYQCWFCFIHQGNICCLALCLSFSMMAHGRARRCDLGGLLGFLKWHVEGQRALTTEPYHQVWHNVIQLTIVVLPEQHIMVVILNQKKKILLLKSLQFDFILFSFLLQRMVFNRAWEHLLLVHTEHHHTERT